MSTTPPATSPIDDAALAAHCHLSHLEFCREQARWSGDRGEVVERDGVLLFATATDFPVIFNGVARLDPWVPASHVLDVAEAWFGERHRGWSVLASDLTTGVDEDLAAAAEARDLFALGQAPAMVCEGRLAEAVVPDELEARWVGAEARVDDFVVVSDSAYRSLGMPPEVVVDLVHAPASLIRPHLRIVVLHDRISGDPLACALLLLSHGIAGVYYVSTLEAARGRGLAELATRLVTNDGFNRGAAFVTLQSSPMGEGIYRRMGYRDLYRSQTFTRFV